MATRKGTLEIMDLRSFYKNKKVLVTGHTGFKGTWLCLWLKQMGADVYGYALRPEKDRESLFHLVGLETSMNSQFGDIREQVTFANYIQKTPFDIVFHLAAQPLVRDSYVDPIYTYNTNVMGSLYILEALRTCPSVRSAIFITTDKCYQNNEWVWPYRENDRLGGDDPYSSSKAMSELAIHSYRKSFFKDSNTFIATARGGNVVGGGDFSKDRIIPDIIQAIYTNQPVVLRNPQSVRPWQHVMDALSGYLLLGKKGFEAAAKCSPAYNFSSLDNANDYTVQKITEVFIKNIGRGTFSVDKDTKQPHEANLLRLDSSLAQKELAWSPLYTTEKAIQTTAEWYKAFLEDKTTAKKYTETQIEKYMKDVQW